MTDKIAVGKPLVVLHGDEMAQIAFDRILEQFVNKYLDIPLIEIDLSAENRVLSNGQVVVDAIEALKQYGVGIKNAGMTVNRDQLDDLLAKHSHIKEAELDRLATRSPNGAIRKGIGGNITREDIHFRNIEVKRPDWVGRDIDVITMDSGGIQNSHNELSKATGVAKLVFVGSSGDPIELHRRFINKGDPLLFMSNDREAIKDWVYQVFRDASVNDKEVYFGLKREFMAYDDVFSTVIKEVRTDLAKHETPPPSFMIMRPSNQLKKMITDPPREALYPAQNLDGDIFSDISAALGGSLATASSIIESKDGTMLYEAPHGTAHDLYLKYLESDGKEALFNSSALLYALANALETIGNRAGNEKLCVYATALKLALIDTVDQGTITGDLKGKTSDPENEKLVDMFGFLDAVESNLKLA